MKYEIGQTVAFDENDETVRGEVLDIMGDSYVIGRGLRESLVHESRIKGIAENKKIFGIFEEGGQFNASDIITEINNTAFYRFYPESKNPFSISTDTKNKYGFGVYFLDNPYYYANRFSDARLITIKPKLKNPLVLLKHRNTIPNFEYAGMVLTLLKKKEINNRDDLSRKLMEAGYDSLVISEPRGLYLVMFGNDPELFEVVSDVYYVSPVSHIKNGGNIPNKKDIIMLSVVNELKSDNLTEQEIFFLSKNYSLAGYKTQIIAVDKYDIAESLRLKDILERNYERDGYAYSITDEGMKLLEQIEQLVIEKTL
jgi:hypothetical protein